MDRATERRAILKALMIGIPITAVSSGAAALIGAGSPKATGATALDSLTDVEVPAPANDDVLTFESSTSLWKNKPAGAGTDIRVKVSSADTTADFLNPKIAVGTGITKTILSPGANEQLEIAGHLRLHALSDALDHSGSITDSQHGTRTLLDAHAWPDVSAGINTHTANFELDQALFRALKVAAGILPSPATGAQIFVRVPASALETASFQMVDLNWNLASANAAGTTIIGLNTTGTLKFDGGTIQSIFVGMRFGTTLLLSAAETKTLTTFSGVLGLGAVQTSIAGASLTITDLSGSQIQNPAVQQFAGTLSVTTLRAAWLKPSTNLGAPTVTTTIMQDIEAANIGTTRIGLRQTGTDTNRLTGKTRIGDQTLPTETLEALGNILATANLKQSTSPGTPSGLGNTNDAGTGPNVPWLDHVHKRDVRVRKNTGADIGTRNRLNLIEGTNITLTVADDSVDDEIDITVAAAGGAGAGLTRISGASGAAGADLTWQQLSADAAVITSVTPTVVMTTTGVGAGTWAFKYLVRYRSAATTTGIGIGINHTGTTGAFVMDWFHITTGGAAATGIGDQVAATVAGQLAEGKAERVKNTVTTASAGVDTANADMLAIVEGLIEVTVSGSLELKVRTEIAGSGITVKAFTLLELHKIA